MILDILFVALFILCAVIGLILVVYFLVRHRLKFDPADKDINKIVIYGDVRSSYKMHNHIANMISRENPDMILFTGDIASNSHNFLHYLIFSIIENKLWKKCEYYPIRGNHESEIYHYQIFLDLPKNKTYYSFDRMGMHFIVLDVIDESIHTELVTWELFEAYNVIFVFSAHVHSYERSIYKGTNYIVTAGGGAPLYPATIENKYKVCRVNDHHYCVMTRNNEDEYTIKVIDKDGNQIDEVTSSKAEMIAGNLCTDI